MLVGIVRDASLNVTDNDVGQDDEWMERCSWKI